VQPEEHLPDAKGRYAECPPDAWFAMALDDGELWAPQLAGRVKEELARQGPLAWDEWCARAQAEAPANAAKRRASDAQRRALSLLSAAVCDAACALNPGAPSGRPIVRVECVKLSGEDGHVDAVLRCSEAAAERAVASLAAIIGIAAFNPGDSALAAGENSKQLLRGATAVVRGCPERRFVLGLSMEGRSMRLWKFDRGAVLVPQPLDCDKEPQHLICFLLHAS